MLSWPISNRGEIIFPPISSSVVQQRPAMLVRSRPCLPLLLSAVDVPDRYAVPALCEHKHDFLARLHANIVLVSGTPQIFVNGRAVVRSCDPDRRSYRLVGRE